MENGVKEFTYRDRVSLAGEMIYKLSEKQMLSANELNVYVTALDLVAKALSSEGQNG